MEQNYLLQIKTPKTGTLALVIAYDGAGELVRVELRDYPPVMNEKQRNWLWGVIPKHATALDELGKIKSITITPIDSDLSFDAFWDAYDYKQGNKKRAKKHWDKMNNATRAIAMQKVKEYNFYIQHQSFGKVFAERWLGQERYENDFRV